MLNRVIQYVYDTRGLQNIKSRTDDHLECVLTIRYIVEHIIPNFLGERKK